MGEAGALTFQTFASVWDALEDAPERAAALRLRSDLLHGIVRTVETWGLTRAQVEMRLGITSARLDDLLQGHIDLLSLDDLVAIASRAEVVVRVEMIAPAD